MIILYGNDNSRIDITDIVREKYTDNQGKLCIPSNDHMRAKMFGDPAYGQAKFIKIFDDELNSRIYGSGQYAHLSWDCDFRNVPPFNNRQQLLEQLKKVTEKHTFNNNVDWVKSDSTKFSSDETYEQLMTLQFLNPEAKVLELGGNVGRNSMLINDILKNAKHHVVLESSPDIAKCLVKNRDDNHKEFHVEDAALSKRRLVQKHQSWQTVSTDDNIDGSFIVRNVTLPELEQKYGFQFDTLIADCEGGLFHLLKDDPSVLDNIRMIMVENDYFDQSKHEFVENIYMSKGFKKLYTDNHPQVQMRHDMFFFEVWVR